MSEKPFALNQFGQKLERGSVVGHANRSGSFTERKVGVVTGFGVRQHSYGRDDMVAKVTWVHSGGQTTWPKPLKSPGVDVNKLFVLDDRTIDRDIVNAIIDALAE